MGRLPSLNILISVGMLLISIVALVLFKLPELTVPTVFSCLTLFIICHSYVRNELGGFLYRFFFVYSAITLVLPFLLVVIFEPTIVIKEFYKELELTSSDLMLSNLIIFGFFLGLKMCLLMLKRIIPVKTQFGDTENLKSNREFYFGRMLTILLISFAAKLYLITTGAWFIFNSEFESDAFTNTFRVLEKLDLFVFFLLIYKKKQNQLSPAMSFVLYIFLPISFGFALISGSKEKMIVQAVAVLLYLAAARYRKILFATLGAAIIIAPSAFEFLYFARTNNELNLTEISDLYLSRKTVEKSVLIDNVLLRRLDYNRVVAKVIREYPMFPNEIQANYLDNVIGLVPRLIWPSKPNMGLDYNKIGRDLGLLNEYDFNTSAGVSPLGEAYYAFGILGLPFIVLCTGVMLFFIRGLFSEGNIFGYAMLITLTLGITPLNSYMTFLPFLLKIVLVLLGAKILIQKPPNINHGLAKL